MRPLKTEDQQRLEELYAHLKERKGTYLGYPNSALLDNGNLSKFLDLAINNVGDPFVGNNGMHTCDLEKEVLEFFRELLHLEASDCWGYVTNGGTESNTFGLFLARESYPNGIVYYSEDTHYSVPKAVRLLNLRDAVIRSQPNGEIDYEHLRQTIHTLRRYPVIINANIGTTMKGAIDNVEMILNILRELDISRYYIHCDAALFGSMLPFQPEAPLFDFRLPIGSIAISGHKFLGSPIPCGIMLTRREWIDKVKGAVEYIGSLDSTLSGSRDGFSVLVLWQAIKRWHKEGLKELVQGCLESTQFTLDRLREIDWPSWANPHSNIVVIRRPRPDIARRWQLASHGDISHLILMPGVTRVMIDQFVHELSRSESRSLGQVG